MRVVNRKNEIKEVELLTIHDRIKKACEYANVEDIDPVELSSKVCVNITDMITTSELDDITVSICMNLSTKNPKYKKLGSMIAISNHQRKCPNTFDESIEYLFNGIKREDGERWELVDPQIYHIAKKFKQEIQDTIKPERDFLFDFFGFKTLERAYLLKDIPKSKPIETPQYMWMRVALGIHKEDFESVKNTYNLMSTKMFTHATPTLFNSGTVGNNMISCFAGNTLVDTLDGPKKISEVQIGDKVVTHKGNVKSVSQLHKNDLLDRKMYVLNVCGSRPVEVTGNHKFWTVCERNAPQWKSVEDITENDFVCIPNNKQSTQTQPDSLKAGDIDIKIDSSFMRFLGLWYRQGDITDIGFKIRVPDGDTSQYKFTHNYLTWVFGKDAVNVKYEDDYDVIVVDNVPIRDLFLTKYEYREILDEFYNYPSELIDNFLQGLTYKNGCVNNNKIFICNLYTLCRLNNIPIRHIDDTKLAYTKVALNETMYHEDFRFLKVRSKWLSKRKYNHVYNLGVDDDNSYSICGLIAKNCFLLGVEDSIEGMYKAVADCAKISKFAGGIGLHISELRSSGSIVKTTNGISTGIKKYMKVLNDTARHVNQGGKRSGSFALYLEPWHPDVFDFLDAGRNHGAENDKSRDLFYAMWVPDAFMEAVTEMKEWYLVNPAVGRELIDLYGEEFTERYYQIVEKYKHTKDVKKIQALDLWNHILTLQKETGMPYITYKCNVNRKSPQQNVGTIRSSNLCSEITLYSDTKEYACCNLVSLRLHSFLKKPDVTKVRIYGKNGCVYCKLSKAYLHTLGLEYDYIPLDDELLCQMFYKKYDVSSVPQIFIDDTLIGGFEQLRKGIKYDFDYDSLRDTIQTSVKNLNIIIDTNHYPVPETKLSNMRHRPIGIGVQGLANVFEMMWLGYQSEEAQLLNKEIFEHMYFYALEASMELSKIHGPYSTFEGSPMSKGILQFDMWGVVPITDLDWGKLKSDIQEHGLYNSNLMAMMPTSSTAQILGSNESFEAFTSNMYTRSTSAGEFTIVRDSLIQILSDLGLWDETMKNRIMYYRGQIDEIYTIPEIIRDIYKTSWEMSNKTMIDMSAARGAYICQTQSLNMFIKDPSLELLSKIQTYGWKSGLKTSSYYIRTKAAISAQSFTVDPMAEEFFKKEREQGENDPRMEECLGCGS